jgi:nitrogen regulatory protein PII
MKKFEVIMKPAAFNTFRASAARLGISEYDVSDVRFSTRVAVAERRRFYRGQEYDLELLSRIKVEFALFDKEAKSVAQDLLGLIAPDSIAISPLEEVVSISDDDGPTVPLPRPARNYPEMIAAAH